MAATSNGLTSIIPEYEIIISKTKEDIQQCIDLRIQVFHIEQGFPLETEIDSMEEVATHFLLRLTPSLKPIGTIRGYPVPNAVSVYKLSRLAVLKEYRQFSFGRALVMALHSWVNQAASSHIDSDAAEIVSHSQLPVKGFYEKFGYQPQGEEFDEDGEPHQKMVLRLPITYTP